MHDDTPEHIVTLALRNRASISDPVHLRAWAGLGDRTPVAAFVDGVDLVVVRWDEQHSVLSGRCRHRGALLADGASSVRT